VRCISTVHHEETGAPRYLVQVIFYEVASGNHYIAGELARPDQIWIRGDLRSGRTEEQKGKILRRILQGVAKSTAAAEEAVWVYLSDIPATNIVEYGRVLPLPGNEDALVRGAPRSFEGEAGTTSLTENSAPTLPLVRMNQ